MKSRDIKGAFGELSCIFQKLVWTSRAKSGFISFIGRLSPLIEFSVCASFEDQKWHSRIQILHQAVSKYDEILKLLSNAIYLIPSYAMLTTY